MLPAVSAIELFFDCFNLYFLIQICSTDILLFFVESFWQTTRSRILWIQRGTSSCMLQEMAFGTTEHLLTV